MATFPNRKLEIKLERVDISKKPMENLLQRLTGKFIHFLFHFI